MPQSPGTVFYDPNTGHPVTKKFYDPDTGQRVPEVAAPRIGPGPGPGSRFVRSAWQQVNPVAAVEGLANMVAHPIDTAAMVSANTMMKVLESRQAGQEGRTGDAATSAVGAIPFYGPGLETGIQQARQGDIAGAAGTLAGLAVPVLRPLRAAKNVGLAGVRRVAPQTAGRVASRLEQIAAGKVAKVMAPEVGLNKTRLGNQAAKVAPELLDRNLTDVWSREGLHDQVRSRLDAAAQALDEVSDARPSWRDYESADVVAALKAKRAEIEAEAIVASKWPRRVDDEGAPITEPYGHTQVAAPIRPRVAAINRAIKEVEDLGPTVRYEALRRLRAGHDQAALAKYASAVTPDYIKNQSAQMGAADVTGALREFLASKDPATAAANAEWSLFKKAHDVLRATEEVERSRPSRGTRMVSRVTGSIVGSKVAGLMGAVIGYAVAPAAEVSIGMGVTTRLKLATGLDHLGKAIRSGNPSRIRWTAGQLKRSMAQAGVLTQNLREGNEPPYPPIAPVASHEVAAPVAPAAVQSGAAGRYEFADQSVWVKAADGSVRRVQ